MNRRLAGNPRCLLAPILLWAIAFAAPAGAADPVADFYVSPAGRDDWSGRLAQPNDDASDGPLASLGAARDAVRRARASAAPQASLRVLIRGGTYALEEPVVFTADDSGTEAGPIVYEAWPGERPVFSGAVPITGWQRQAEGPLWTVAVDRVKAGEWYFRELFVDGRRCTPARWPNEGEFRAAGPGVDYKDRNQARGDRATKISLHYRNDDLQPWPDLEEAVVVVYHSWTTSRHRIRSLDTQNRLVEFTAPSGWPMGWWEKDQRYYVENIRAALDQPGEFHLDRETGVLSYYPRAGEDMATAEAMAPRLQVLLRLAGEPAAGDFVEHLHFRGLTFAYTGWQMPEAATVDGQAAAFLQDATVFARGARHCRFDRCEIAHTGGYGLWLENGCQHNRVVQCRIHDLGAGGVRLGQTSLPGNEPEQAAHNTVENCFIHDGGKVYHAGVGVWIGRSSHNKILHNEICDFLYTGVSVGWSWGYAPSTAHHNEIRFNRIHHLGWGQLSDMGGIYCLGLSPGTELTHNVIHDVLSYSYGGWGLYTDEGSTEILMENNVVYRVKDGAFHQHYGRENTVRNNILAMSATYGQIRRSREEDHRSFTIERNIIYCDPAQPLGGNWSNDNFLLRNNLYYRPEGRLEFPGGRSLEQWQEAGHDAGSIAADPKFVDAANHDFRLDADSPALELGFQPIDTRTVGLTGPPEWVDLPRRVERPPLKLPPES